MLLQGLTQSWPMPFWILIQILFWTLLVRSIFLLDVNRLRSFSDVSAWASSLIFFRLIMAVKRRH